MATFKVKFRPSTVKGHEGTIYYQIIHERKVRQLITDYHIYPSEWGSKLSITTGDEKNERQNYVFSINEYIRLDIERLNKIKRKLETEAVNYTIDELIFEFRRFSQEYSLFNFMTKIIERLKNNGKIRTSETYKTTLNNFKRFRHDKDIMLDCLSAEIMEDYEAWQHDRGIVPNTISFYQRILRAVYNRAVEDNIIEDRKPFRHVYTGIDKTIKRAIPLNIIKKIKELDLSQAKTLDYARDMFMISFYLRGMSFIDMSYLRKSDLQNGHIVYRRRKTGQQLIIEWTDEMQAIIEKYPANNSDYLLPIIKTASVNERCVYRNASYNINRNLKQIAVILKLNLRLTMYVARHSWASAAKSKGIPINVISEGMGHDSENTTKIYLANFDNSVIDRANAIILQSLK